jgi:Flp pilus assembly protein TadD
MLPSISTSQSKSFYSQYFWTPILVLGIFAATFAAYFPAIRGALLWDDDAHVTAKKLRSLGGLWRIWFKLGATQQYYPVLHSAFWLEHRVWGDSVLGYHVLNVGLHATAACLFALVLVRIRPEKKGRALWAGGEWLAAAIFALHPVCVESVAWISEQKNTLSLVFYLLSALSYLRFDRGRRWTWYVIAFVFFAMALLSKSVTATLPAALLLALTWHRVRISWRRDVVPLLPWFVVAACAGIFTAWVERRYIGAQGQAFDLGFVERLFLAGRIVWFYLGKLLWPIGLEFVYPRWQVIPNWQWSLGCIGLAAALTAFWCIRKWSVAPLLAVLFFVGTLFPALGFFNVYPFIFSYVADHFQYMACLGIIALAADGGGHVARDIIQGLVGSRRAAVRTIFGSAAVALLAVLFAITWQTAAHYRNPAVLYRDTLAKNPSAWMIQNNLGKYLMDMGSPNEAVVHLKESLRLRPDYSEAHNNLGVYLMSAGLPGEGIAEFEAAIKFASDATRARENLGLALIETPGRSEEGVSLLQAALHDDGDDPEAAGFYLKLGAALAKARGRLPEAISNFEAAVRLEPNNIDARGSLGNALARAGRTSEAIKQFEAALMIRSDNPKIHNNLGIVLAAAGKTDEAMAQFREALRLAPTFSEARFNLALTLRRAGRTEEAAAEFSAPGRPEP